MRNKDWYATACATLWKANEAYYGKDDPILTDAEYDSLYREIQKYEAGHPDEVEPNSPTQMIGGLIGNSFKKVKHPRIMGSLQNAFNLEELQAFAERD